jgi:hypothetical protein
VVFNGSRLGREFSANAFQTLFNENESNTPKQNHHETEQTPVNTPQKPDPDTGKSIISSVADGVFDVLDILQPFDLLQPHGENYDEIAFARKKRRKKRLQKPNM